MINENIKYYCKVRGIKYADLADRLKITRQSLHAQGTGAPSLSSIEKIAAALEVPAWKLLHPDPRTLEAPPVLSLPCPLCGGRLKVTIQPAEQDDQTQAGPAVTTSKMDRHNDSRQETTGDRSSSETLFQ